MPAVSDIPDPLDVSQAPGPRGRIEFDDVTFRYPDAAPDTRPTLDHVSFTVEPGQHVALVGPSGSGKSTILYLAPRLYQASSGVVRFAGADIRTLSAASIIDDVGIVTQETYLFHATIAENLRYAKPDATDEELVEVCTAANIHHIIAGFEDGYNTVVGERGYRLSGGEKQRIAIARVLLKDPPVLLLDEATSALDTVSERVVQEAIDEVAHGRTTITVAHRLSTIVDAGGLYAELAAQQVSAARIEGVISADKAPLPERRADECPQADPDDLQEAAFDSAAVVLAAAAPWHGPAPAGASIEWPPVVQQVPAWQVYSRVPRLREASDRRHGRKSGTWYEYRPWYCDKRLPRSGQARKSRLCVVAQ